MVIEFVLVVSKDQEEPEFSLYLILYPQAPDTISQFNVASDKVILVVLGFCGLTQGINVVNTSEDDHADTEELSELHADLTCHS